MNPTDVVKILKYTNCEVNDKDLKDIKSGNFNKYVIITKRDYNDPTTELVDNTIKYNNTVTTEKSFSLKEFYNIICLEFNLEDPSLYNSELFTEGISVEDYNNIAKLTEAVANDSLSVLTFKGKELKEIGKSFNHITPLKCLAFQLGDAKMKSNFLKLKDRGFLVWNNYKKTIIKDLTENYKNRETFIEDLEFFTKLTNCDYNVLITFLSKDKPDFSKFLDSILSQVFQKNLN